MRGDPAVEPDPILGYYVPRKFKRFWDALPHKMRGKLTRRWRKNLQVRAVAKQETK